MPLTLESIRGLLPRGGTILGTSRTNPYKSDDGAARVTATPSRSTSKGFIRTSAAGNGQFMLCWSIALEIASRFFASGEAIAASYGARVDR